MALVWLAFSLLLPSILTSESGTDESVKLLLSVGSKTSELSADAYQYYSAEAKEAVESILTSLTNDGVIKAIEGDLRAFMQNIDIFKLLKALTIEVDVNANCVQDETRKELNEIVKEILAAGKKCALEEKSRADEHIKSIQDIDVSIKLNDGLCFSLRVERSEKCDIARESLVNKLKVEEAEGKADQLRKGLCVDHETTTIMLRALELQKLFDDCTEKSGNLLHSY